MPLPAVDYQRTSARPPFAALPEPVRAAVGELAGSPVATAAAPVGSGFTGGFAGRVVLADGRAVFVKAAGPSLGWAVDGLAQEALVLPLVQRLRCAPRLRAAGSTVAGDGRWWILVLDPVDGRHPGAPWRAADAQAAHDACLEIAAVAADALPGIEVPTLAEDVLDRWGVHGVYADLAAGRRSWPTGVDAPGAAALEDAADLLARAGAALAGDRLCHGDLRPDNLLIAGGAATVLDWNWVRSGPAWADFVGLWAEFAHDGLDLGMFSGSPLLAGTNADQVDSWLAAIAAYMLEDAEEPVPFGCTPALRDHQRRHAALFLDLLAARRGWPRSAQ